MTKGLNHTLFKKLLIIHIMGLCVLLALIYRGYVYQNVRQVSAPIQKSSQEDSSAENVLASQLLISQFQTGSTLSQYSLDNWGNSTAVNAAKSLFSGSTKLGAQHVMGFGVLNPQPTSTSYDWSTLDQRMHQSLSGVNSTVLVACCAPDWMKGGVSGQTNWSRIEDAPLAQHYDSYANLIAQTVKRYPQIKYVLVWNEMKGMWNYSANRWNHEGYTQLYNKVWAKVKAVRSSVQIGGPYVVLNSRGTTSPYNSSVGGSWGYLDSRDLDAIKYWFRYKTGADFIAVDTSNTNRDNVYTVDRFAMTEKFVATSSWIRGLSETTHPGASSLPIWWAEWYAFTENDADSHTKKAAVMTTGLIKTIKSGAATALIWGPQGDTSGSSFPLGLFTDTRVSGGGKATAFYNTQKYINDYFSKGKRIVRDGNTNKNIEALASDSKILLVNKTGSKQTTNVLGKSFILAGYQVALENAPAPTTGGGNVSSGSGSSNPTTSSPSNGASSLIQGLNESTDGAESEGGMPTEGEFDEQGFSGQEEAAVDLTPLSSLVQAMQNDQPVTIGKRKIPIGPIKYITIATVIITGGGLVYVSREYLYNAQRNILNMIKGNRF